MKKNKLRTLFIKLKILEVVNNEERVRRGEKILGRGYRTACRFNKLNPLTYMFLFIFYIVSFVGFVTVSLIQSVVEIAQILKDNPFKWR